MHIHRYCLSPLLVLAAIFAAGSNALAAQAPTVDAPVQAAGFVLLKSEFNDTVGFGKDPFFPKSTRRQGPRPVTTNTVVEPAGPNVELSLKGISGTRERPLAIINNRTFAVGEVAHMKVKNEVVRVQCIEINDKVVKMTVNGVPQEFPRPQR